MNKTTIKRLRTLADHVERFELPALSAATSLTFDEVAVQLWDEGPRIPIFLAWADTLGGPAVDVTAKIFGDAWHLTARGVLCDDTPVKVSVVIHTPEREGLDDELGNTTVDVPVHRDVLAKIADPELLDDRPTLTEEQLAEVEHWSKTPMPHEVTP